MTVQTITDRMLAQEVVQRQSLEVFLKELVLRLDGVQDWETFERELERLRGYAESGIPRSEWASLANQHWQRTQP